MFILEYQDKKEDQVVHDATVDSPEKQNNLETSKSVNIINSHSQRI